MITQLTENSIGVQVPEGSHGFMFSTEQLWLCAKPKQTWRRFFCELPEGNWKILGLGKDLTEDQWKEVVEQQSGGLGRFKDYELTGSLADHGTYILYSALKSGLSLLRSKGLQGENTLILIK